MPVRNKVYLVAGVPGSGKTWACSQVRDLYLYLEHDVYIDNEDPQGDYVKDIIELSSASAKPLLIETPFSVSKLMGPLQQSGLQVKLLYLCEDRFILSSRYESRENKEIPKGHLTRNRTFLDRALTNGDWVGTSEELIKELRRLAND